MNSSVYLVVEPIHIIAEDLAMSVQDYDPSATVLIAPSPEAACAVLAGEGFVRLAFVNLDARRFHKTDLARALVARGTKVVFAGGFSEPEGSELLVLDRPFSAETTAALLQRAEMLKIA